MKVITEPKVTLVGHTVFVEHSKYKVPSDGTDMERLGAFAAKSCYDTFGEDGRACLDNQREVIEHKHGSVLEHSYASVFLEGITRALTLELNRHRTFNISQRSTRYTKEEDSAMVLEPFYASIWEKYHLQWNDNTQWVDIPKEYSNEDEWPLDLVMLMSSINQFDMAIMEYAQQVAWLEELNPNNLKGFALRKWARGKARNITPHALETRGTWTMNMRAWRWFLEARSNQHAETEIRRLAEHIFLEVSILAPVYFEDFSLSGIYDGVPEYTPKHSKV